MDYVSKLEDGELRIICELVPLQHFRDSFKSNPQRFHKIWSGCRPEKVSLEIVQKLAVTHRRTPFISDVMNNGIQVLLDDMQNTLTASIDAGKDIHAALLQLMPKSLFNENIDLYLKLSAPSYTQEYSELMRSALKEIEEAKKTPEVEQAAVRLDDTPRVELERLRDELEKAKNDLSEQQAKEEKQNSAYSKLEKELKEKEQELTNLRTLIDHADFSTDDPLNEMYPYVSLCRVVDVNERNTKLRRLADIANGVIQTRWWDDFPDRTDLYTKDPVQPSGPIGIWSWRITRHPYYDWDGYVESKFLANQQPAQIIMVPGCGTIEELKERLLQGINCCPESERMLFSFTDGEKYKGLLCEKNNLLLQGGTVALLPNIAALNLYTFSEPEITKIGRLWFYYQINLGIAQERVRIADPFKIIKQRLREGPVTMKKLRPVFGKATSQKIREFLDEVPTLDFYEAVAAACDCSLEESKDYTNAFIQRAEIYLREDDIETEVLETALEHSASLLEKCRALIEDRWRREHTEQLESAEAKLREINDEIRRETKLRDQLSEEQKRLKEQQESLTSCIAQNEQLAKDVEEQVARRIDAAKKNVADFICEMAFAYPGVIGQSAITAPAGLGLFQPGEVACGEPLEFHDAQGAVYSIQDELERAGISEKRSMNFAAFLYAAFTSKTPLLLAGPNGRDIANALSAALFAKSASSLRCENDFFPDAVEACMCNEEKIVVIMNPLNSGWINRIPEIISRQEKFFVMVHPFAEDLLIEPRGLYNYMLPVLTELLVERAPVGNYRGGYFGSDFADYVHADPQKPIPLVKEIAMPALMQNRLQQILADTKSLLGDDNADDDFLFGVVPYAYATGKMEMLRENSQNNPTISKDTRNLLQAFLGEAE